MCDTKEFCRGRFQRYKGIELFFKRLAFNLGNSPSQTEVKIISCVPIDVTEMQQRINALEKELDELSRRGGGVNIQTALHTPTFNPERYNNTNQNLNVEQAPPLRYPNFGSYEDNNVTNLNVTADNNMNRDPPTNTTYPENLSDSDVDTTAAVRNSSATSLDYSCSVESPRQEKTSPIRSIFRRTKKPKRYKNDALVYHAKTIDTPLMFQTKKRPRKHIPKKEEFFNRSYVRNLMRKQQESTVEDNQSIQSTPVCRDVSDTVCHQRYEADACSSCHVKFQDIDNYAPKLRYNRRFYTNNDVASHSYYDDELYDMVPVRDESNKPKKTNMELPKKYNRDEGQVNIGSPYVKRKLHPSDDLKVIHRKQLQYKRDQLINKMSEKPSFCIVEYGDVYTKSITSDANIRRMARNKTPIQKNTVVLKINEGTNTVCEIATGTDVPPEQAAEPKEIKTEETLDQIKTILRSVLSEVKSNTVKQRNQNAKTDAVVQKDVSQIDMFKRSRLLQSYTYSPYDMNPYVTSCNRQPGTNPSNLTHSVPYHSSYSYPNRCQTFPLIVQQSPILSKPFCASCSTQNSPLTKPFPLPTLPTTTSTNANTSSCKKLNTETEQLIKEIYNSLHHDIIPSTEPEQVPSKITSRKSVKPESLQRNITLTTIKSASPLETMMNTSSSALESRTFTTSRDRDSRYQRDIESRHVVERRRLIGMDSERVLSPSDFITPQHSRNEKHSLEHDAYHENHHHHHHDHHHDIEEENEELLNGVMESEDERETVYVYTTEESDDEELQVIKTEKPKGLFSKLGAVFKKRSIHRSKRNKRNETFSESEVVTDADEDDYPPEPRRPEGITIRKPGKPIRIGATMSTNTEAQIEKEYQQIKDHIKMRHKNSPERHHNYYHQNYLVQNAMINYDNPPIRSRYREQQQQQQHRNNNQQFEENQQDDNLPQYNRPIEDQQYGENEENYAHGEQVPHTSAQNNDRNDAEDKNTTYVKVTSKGTDMKKPMKVALADWLKDHRPRCGPEWKKMITEL